MQHSHIHTADDLFSFMITQLICYYVDITCCKLQCSFFTRCYFCSYYLICILLYCFSLSLGNYSIIRWICVIIQLSWYPCPVAGPVSSQYPERSSVAPGTTHTLWGSQALQLGQGALRWPKRRVSVPCAVTMPPGTTMGCGPVRVAKPSSRGASRVFSWTFLFSAVCDLWL